MAFDGKRLEIATEQPGRDTPIWITCQAITFLMMLLNIFPSLSAAIAQLGERRTEDLKVPGSTQGLGMCRSSYGHVRSMNVAITCTSKPSLFPGRPQKKSLPIALRA